MSDHWDLTSQLNEEKLKENLKMIENNKSRERVDSLKSELQRMTKQYSDSLNKIDSHAKEVEMWDKTVAAQKILLDDKQKEIKGLKSEKAKLREVLQAWDDFETRQIEKEGPYAGDEINKLIENTRQTLAKIKKGE